MKTNYVTPSIEIIEVEVEDAILSGSGTSATQNYLDPFDEGGNAW
ncbi:MAG: hypothetical protein SNI45_07335 [Rikenellaceae bacterium]